jgi:hypothetical protein
MINRGHIDQPGRLNNKLRISRNSGLEKTRIFYRELDDVEMSLPRDCHQRNPRLLALNHDGNGDCAKRQRGQECGRGAICLPNLRQGAPVRPLSQKQLHTGRGNEDEKQE